MHDDLTAMIDRHLARTGESPTAFGRRICGDPNLVRDLNAGRHPKIDLYERIMDACAAKDDAA